jgi:hypothetical protein
VATGSRNDAISLVGARYRHEGGSRDRTAIDPGPPCQRSSASRETGACDRERDDFRPSVADAEVGVDRLALLEFVGDSDGVNYPTLPLA